MPAGELRRRDREMSAEDSLALMDRALACRVGTVAPDGWPYVVPMSFAFDEPSRSILLHCATSGNLLENLAADPRVCVEIDEPGDVVATTEYACGTSQVYSSVICFGRARILSDDWDKRRALEAFVRKYVDRLTPDRRYDPEMTTIDSTVAISVRVERLTGKRRPKP